MKPGTKVITEFGPGIILYQEGETGVKSHRYCVELDLVPMGLVNIHNKYNGVFFYDSKMTVIKQIETPEQGKLF